MAAASIRLGLIRLVGIVLLLTGVVAMHVGVFANGHAHEADAMPSHHSLAMADVGATISASDPCLDDGCDTGHAMVHACVFVLSTVALMVVLTLLWWIGIDRVRRVLPSKLLFRSGRRGRAPPWTVLTLSELSILRI
ncbi:DUF6153 family protein [Antrihabitans stalactiti]|uniref:Uncharacterized protein n=1 Tax=Antrihabitans stalactiti TaxID=2584121 RepID=A0A848KFP8_9NOCA|nr:hypothetical protein [Antrihabitans stalactiti]